MFKVEEEIVTENINNESVNEVNNQYHEELVKSQEVENIIENTSNDDEKSFSQEVLNSSESSETPSNDLKEFGVDTNEPDLFSSDNQNLNSDDLLGSIEEDQEEEDELDVLKRCHVCLVHQAASLLGPHGDFEGRVQVLRRHGCGNVV